MENTNEPVERVTQNFNALGLAEAAVPSLSISSTTQTRPPRKVLPADPSHDQRLLVRGMIQIQVISLTSDEEDRSDRNAVVHAHEAKSKFQSLAELALRKGLRSAVDLVPRVDAYGDGGELREALEFFSWLLSVDKEDAYQHMAMVFDKDPHKEDVVKPNSVPNLASVSDLLGALPKERSDELKKENEIIQRYNFWKNSAYIGDKTKPENKTLLSACQSLVREEIGFNWNHSEDDLKTAFESWEYREKFALNSSKREGVVNFFAGLCTKRAQAVGLLDAMPYARDFPEGNPYKLFLVIREISKIRNNDEANKTVLRMKDFVTRPLLATVRNLIDFQLKLDGEGILAKSLFVDFSEVWEAYLDIIEEWLLAHKPESDAAPLPRASPPPTSAISSSSNPTGEKPWHKRGGGGSNGKGGGNSNSGGRGGHQQQVSTRSCDFFHKRGGCRNGNNCRFQH